jgi:tetratricopeptide (TPR) repeat protein
MFLKMSVILLFATGTMLAHPQIVTPDDEQIMDLIFNAAWNQADSLIDQRIDEQPDNAKYYYMKLPLYYYTRYYNNGLLNGDSLMQLVYDYAQKTIEAAEKSEDSAEKYFYLGCAYDYLSRYYIRATGRWDAYWAARKSVNYLKNAVEENPKFYDAYMGLGVIEYFTSTQITGLLRSVAWIVGMLGDREEALSKFHTVAENGVLCKNEAQFALVSVYRYIENDYETSHSMAASLLEHVPNNSFIRNIYHQTELLQIITTGGVNALTQLPIDTLVTRYHVTNAGVLNQMGYYFIGQNRLRDAEAIFLLNIQIFPESANPYDSIAECYQIMGEYQKSADYSRIALQKLETDQTINNQFRENLRQILNQRLQDLTSEVNI